MGNDIRTFADEYCVGGQFCWQESFDAKFYYSRILLNLDAVELHWSWWSEKWWAILLHPALLYVSSMICLCNCTVMCL
jgi:hypothetical protein